MAVDKISMDDLLAKMQAAREALAGSPVRAASKSAESAGGAPKVDFASLLKTTIEQVDNAQHRADALAKEFQLGNPKVSLEETMIAAQEANLSLQTVIQVRNRLISAYHDIMNMQV